MPCALYEQVWACRHRKKAGKSKGSPWTVPSTSADLENLLRLLDRSLNRYPTRSHRDTQVSFRRPTLARTQYELYLKIICCICLILNLDAETVTISSDQLASPPPVPKTAKSISFCCKWTFQSRLTKESSKSWIVSVVATWPTLQILSTTPPEFELRTCNRFKLFTLEYGW